MHVYVYYISHMLNKMPALTTNKKGVNFRGKDILSKKHPIQWSNCLLKFSTYRRMRRWNPIQFPSFHKVWPEGRRFATSPPVTATNVFATCFNQTFPIRFQTNTFFSTSTGCQEKKSQFSTCHSSVQCPFTFGRPESKLRSCVRRSQSPESTRSSEWWSIMHCTWAKHFQRLIIS